MIYNFWKQIRAKKALDFGEYTKYFLYKVALLLSIIGSIIWWFCYYYNEIHPAGMPTYTLTNGEKDVVFQAMSHIWSTNFYESIQTHLKKKKQEWYVYFFEWVQAGTAENMQKFDAALWIEFDADLYKNFSKLYGVDYQDNEIFMNLVNNRDYNIDISVDDIITYYEHSENSQTDTSEKTTVSEIYDINAEVIELLSLLNERQLQVLQYVNQALLNFIIGSDQTQTLIQNNFSNAQLFEIILDKRDDHLADEIITTSEKKIFITYGLLHFDGVFEKLKSNDPNWKIIQTDVLYPIR